MKSAIVCDNYKLKKYKKELEKLRFTFRTHNFTTDTTVIEVEHEDDRLSEVNNLCKKLELNFKRGN